MGVAEEFTKALGFKMVLDIASKAIFMSSIPIIQQVSEHLV